MTNNQPRRVIPILALGLFSVMMSPILVRFAGAAPGMAAAVWRTVFAALLLAPFALPRIGKEVRTFSAIDWGLVLAAGILLGLHFVAWIESLYYTTVASASVLVWTNHFKRPPVPPVSEVAAKEWAEIRVPAPSVAMWLAAGVLAVLAVRGTAARRRMVLGGGAAVAVLLGAVAAPYLTLGVPRPDLAPARMSDQQAVAIVRQLLTNVYRAFDFRGERQVYDRLAKTVDGPLLERVYLDQRRSLRIARAGGAEARVKVVDVESAVPTHVPGTGADFVVRTRWSIVGTVGHWGHVHQRQNRYEADLTLSAASGVWKIAGFQVLDQERLTP